MNNKSKILQTILKKNTRNTRKTTSNNTIFYNLTNILNKENFIYKRDILQNINSSEGNNMNQKEKNLKEKILKHFLNKIKNSNLSKIIEIVDNIHEKSNLNNSINKKIILYFNVKNTKYIIYYDNDEENNNNKWKIDNRKNITK